MAVDARSTAVSAALWIEAAPPCWSAAEICVASTAMPRRVSASAVAMVTPESRVRYSGSFSRS